MVSKENVRENAYVMEEDREWVKPMKKERVRAEEEEGERDMMARCVP